MDPPNLTDKERAFLVEYVAAGFNGTKAAKAAGYTEGNARQTASRLLHRPAIRAALRAAIEERMADLEITADRVLLQLMAIAFGDLGTVATWNDGGAALLDSTEMAASARAQVRSIEIKSTKHGTTVKVTTCDRVKALELLGRHVGLFRDPAPDDNRGAFVLWRDAMLREDPAGGPVDPSTPVK